MYKDKEINIVSQDRIPKEATVTLGRNIVPASLRGDDIRIL